MSEWDEVLIGRGVLLERSNDDYVLMLEPQPSPDACLRLTNREAAELALNILAVLLKGANEFQFSEAMTLQRNHLLQCRHHGGPGRADA